MWECRHCKESFDYERTTDKANHSRHCKANPKRLDSYKNVALSIRNRVDNKLGEHKEFTVDCACCGTQFIVIEREMQFPLKEHYFCSRTCANSVGGKAKADKYGYKGYRTIAEKYYKQQCVVCGVTDILDVHHIDENRENSHPSNLIFLCPNDHYRLHRNKDESVIKAIEGHGTAWGGHFLCKEDVSRVQIPDAPPDYFLDSKNIVVVN